MPDRRAVTDVTILRQVLPSAATKASWLKLLSRYSNLPLLQLVFTNAKNHSTFHHVKGLGASKNVHGAFGRIRTNVYWCCYSRGTVIRLEITVAEAAIH